ncbi:unnamed protein product [Gordionus sp. m RMFG-2023]
MLTSQKDSLSSAYNHKIGQNDKPGNTIIRLPPIAHSLSRYPGHQIYHPGGDHFASVNFQNRDNPYYETFYDKLGLVKEINSHAYTRLFTPSFTIISTSLPPEQHPCREAIYATTTSLVIHSSEDGGGSSGHVGKCVELSRGLKDILRSVSKSEEGITEYNSTGDKYRVSIFSNTDMGDRMPLFSPVSLSFPPLTPSHTTNRFIISPTYLESLQNNCCNYQNDTHLRFLTKQQKDIIFIKQSVTEPCCNKKYLKNFRTSETNNCYHLNSVNSNTNNPPCQASVFSPSSYTLGPPPKLAYISCDMSDNKWVVGEDGIRDPRDGNDCIHNDMEQRIMSMSSNIESINNVIPRGTNYHQRNGSVEGSVFVTLLNKIEEPSGFNSFDIPNSFKVINSFQDSFHSFTDPKEERRRGKNNYFTYPLEDKNLIALDRTENLASGNTFNQSNKIYIVYKNEYKK